MDGGTDMMELMAACSNFSNALKNPKYLSCKWHTISLNYTQNRMLRLSKYNINHEDKPSNTHNETVIKDVLSVW
jgi:hypothetical protein